MGAPPTSEATDASDLPIDELGSRVVHLSQVLSSGTFELLVLIGEIDARGAYEQWGALSTAAWLANTCDIAFSTARSQVRVARAMREYPELYAAMATGDVSYAKARMLVPHLRPEFAVELVELAASTATTGLATALAAWWHRNEDDDVIAERQYAERSCFWRTDPDGMVTIVARLAPAEASRVCAAIDAGVTAARSPAGATLAQQRADALVAVTSSAKGASVDTEVVVHVTEDGNHLPDGTPLTDHEVTRLLPESFVSLLLFDTKRQPIDASPRRRTPTRRQRRILAARTVECAHPGCHARVFLQADHIIRYHDEGPTTLDNLRLLCGHHNRAREHDGTTGEATIPGADQDPDRSTSAGPSANSPGPEHAGARPDQ